MKKGEKLVLLSLVLLTLMMTAAGCGKYTNLEEYCDKGKIEKETISLLTDLGDEKMKVSIVENQVVYNYSYDDDFSDELREYAMLEIEKNIESMKSDFQRIAKNIEDQTGLQDIQIKLVYTDKSGHVLYKGWFESSDEE